MVEGNSLTESEQVWQQDIQINMPRSEKALKILDQKLNELLNQKD